MFKTILKVFKKVFELMIAFFMIIVLFFIVESSLKRHEIKPDIHIFNSKK